MHENIIPVESIRERDVDLILLEELSTDNAFCQWFISELDLPQLTSIHGAWRSISAFGLGETDILFSYQSMDKKVFVLIENKLDTSFQEKQFERYVQRKAQHLKENECDDAYVILVAPELYCENQNEFELYISYETIAKRLEFTGTKRNVFKSQLLNIATEKLRRGYQPVNSEPVQRFWHSYWKFKEEKFPSLFMKEPGIVPHESDWPMLYDDRLKNIVLYHKLSQGNTDATFKGYSEEGEYRMKEHCPDWAQFVKHGKNFSLRVFSGKIDRTKDFNVQVDLVEKGLRNLERLRNWLLENKRLFE
jgi:hypothetical protein